MMNYYDFLEKLLNAIESILSLCDNDLIKGVINCLFHFFLYCCHCIL